LRYSHPHATIGQSDTGSNEYEDSSDEYTSEGIVAYVHKAHAVFHLFIEIM